MWKWMIMFWLAFIVFAVALVPPGYADKKDGPCDPGCLIEEQANGPKGPCDPGGC